MLKTILKCVLGFYTGGAAVNLIWSANHNRISASLANPGGFKCIAVGTVLDSLIWPVKFTAFIAFLLQNYPEKRN